MYVKPFFAVVSTKKPQSCKKPGGVLKQLPLLLTNTLSLFSSLTLFFFFQLKSLELNSWFKVVIASLFVLL